ncbi:MAG TPA: TetR family transcriptional regulator [Jiangellales bacterium]|nr:TetR family transcriptional regulator [Jiangellales bacterium]
MDPTKQPAQRMRRAERREQILGAATRAFARGGFAATSLDDIAAEAGVTRVILYRHFESKTDLYRAVLDRFCGVLAERVREPVGGFTDAAVAGLVEAATAEPAGFRLLFQHVAREPEFHAWARQFQQGMTEAAHRQIAAVVADPTWARWASQLAPVVAVEAIIAWLDAGQPDPEHAAERIGQAIDAVITAAARSTVDGQPRPRSRRRAS